jgi:hypothetical protein
MELSPRLEFGSLDLTLLPAAPWGGAAEVMEGVDGEEQREGYPSCGEAFGGLDALMARARAAKC